METARLIPQWTRTHTTTHACSQECADCLERITYGTYRREVVAYTHPKYGDRLEVRKIHEHPVCPKDLEPP